jgi:hypothetical protein
METPQKNISKYQKETYISRFTVDGNQTKWTFSPLIRIFPVLLFPYRSTIFCYHLTYRVTVSEGERERRVATRNRKHASQKRPTVFFPFFYLRDTLRHL